MTSNVIPFGGVTRGDLPPEQVLDEARKREFDGIVILGYTKDGTEYFASSYGNAAPALWLIERLKLMLLRMADV